MLERKILVYSGYRDTVSPFVTDIAQGISRGITVDRHTDYFTFAPRVQGGNYDVVVVDLQLPGSAANAEKRQENEQVLDLLRREGTPTIIVSHRLPFSPSSSVLSPPVATVYTRNQLIDLHRRYSDVVKYSLFLQHREVHEHLTQALTSILTNPAYLLDRIGIVGFGRIGFETAYTLLQGSYTLRSLFVASREGGKTAVNFRKLEDSKSLTAKPFVPLSYGSIEDLLQNSGIVVVTLGNHDSERRMTRREELLQAYILPFVELARQFTSFQGHVVVVTNPTDLLSLVFHLYSRAPDGGGPIVSGMNFLDHVRVTDVLRERLAVEGYNTDLEFRLAGTHTNYGPVVSHALVGGIPWDNLKFPNHSSTPWYTPRGSDKKERLRPTLERVQEIVAFQGALIRELANGETNEKKTAGGVAQNIDAIQQSRTFFASTLVDLLTTGSFAQSSLAQDIARQFPHGMYLGWDVTYRGLGVEPQPLVFEDGKQRGILFRELTHLRKRFFDYIRAKPQKEWRTYRKLIEFFKPLRAEEPTPSSQETTAD